MGTRRAGLSQPYRTAIQARWSPPVEDLFRRQAQWFREEAMTIEAQLGSAPTARG
jgi:hypothetical protein